MRTGVGFLVLACAGLVGCAGGETAARPNVLVLMSDDQSWDTLGCLDHPWLETPAIDRIAREGATFRNAFVTTSLCSPARASFLTGQWARTHGVVTNSQPLSADAVTIAGVLAGAGYETAYFGKWHMGEQSARPGFARRASYDGQGVYRDCEFDVDGRRARPPGFVDDVTTDFLLEFLGEPRARPFLAWVGFKAPHGPREPDPRYADRYTDLTPRPSPARAGLPPFPRRTELEALAAAAGVPEEDYEVPADWARGVEREPAPDTYDAPQVERLRDYARLIDSLDDNVGRILDALDERGLTANTLVVYASDHGFGLGDRGLTGKRTAYEESMRTILLLADPRIEGGVEIDELVLNVDLAPTLLELCGVAVPDSMQGRSAAPLLRGEPGEWRRDFLYEYYRESEVVGPWSWRLAGVPTHLALRTAEPMKLIVYPRYPAWTELYDLARDPWERTPLSAVRRRKRMLERMTELDLSLGPRPQFP